ncbi:C39 family peptidase [Exiguobacterium sp. s193]|uniref:C39 family peptidase n=1 Tax=Exiguobacterium sp. s193 TaxID=2751207 RepID=UPI001BEC7108|nr:C39 family peptidase [Exiguobacterium sp. s193]
MKKIITSFIVAGLMFGVFSPSLVAHAATKLTITTAVLRVREKPTTSSKILGNVVKGNVYTSKGTSGSWYKITYKSRTGYIHKDYVKTSTTSSKYTSTGTKYTTVGTLNVRTGPSTKYKSVTQLGKGVKVATYGTSGSFTRILYSGSYRYVSTQYVTTKKPTTTTTKKLNVPYYNQYSLGYPSGCEFVSLKMALEYKKKAVSAASLYNQMPKSMKNATYKNGKYYWADPEKMFTGNPAGTLDYYKNWGIYPKGILPLAKKYRSGAVDISKQGVSKIEREIRSGNPVIVWATVDFKNPYGYFSWIKPDGKTFTGYRNYHVMLVTGVSSSSFYVSDPYRGKYAVSRAQFTSVYNTTGQYALSVR